MASGAAITLLLYDWMLVFRDEYDTFYQARWSMPKGLLIYIRSITPPTLIFTAFALSDLRPDLNSKICQAWVYVQVMGMLTSLCAASGLLSLRLMALYRRKRVIVWFIGLFFGASYGATFALVIYSLNEYHHTIYYNGAVRVCATTAVSKTMPAIFYAPMAFETFIFSLTAWSAWKDAKLVLGPSSTPFLTVLYRDGAACFLVMTGLRAWNIWIYDTQTADSYNMGTPIMWAVNVVLMTRVYMNLVQLARKPLLTAPTSAQDVGPSINIAMQPQGRSMLRSTISYKYGHGPVSTETGTGYLSSAMHTINLDDNGQDSK